jgi:hypothetical protein
MKAEIFDDTFGLLRQWAYDGQVNFWPETPVQVRISMDCSEETASEEEVVARALPIFASLQGHESAIRRAIANEHQPTYNECWAQSPDDVLTMDKFLAEMTLEDVLLRPGGESTMSYIVGERFTDHTLIAYINDQFEVTYIDFAG